MSQQQETYFRPPSEEDSFIIRVMHGCPHNKCTFCNLFKTVRLRRIPLEDVLAGLDRDAEELGPRFGSLVKSIYLEGGDPVALRAQSLLRIMEHAKSRFPALTRFACYATARFTVQKKQEDLDALGRAGLRRVFVGLESGCDAILEGTHKGCSAADLRLAARMLAHAGIEMDVSMMLGIGGTAFSVRHALDTAELINAIAPVCVRIRTFLAKEGTALGDEYLQGRFALMGPHKILRELRLLVENITCPTCLLSEHWSNFIHFDAPMPHAKAELLAYIDQFLTMPEDSFRQVGLSDSRG